MKSERRHELKHNELADWLANAIDKVQPHTNAILAVVMVVLIAAVAGAFWIRKSKAETANAWQDYHTAVSHGGLADLRKVAEDHPGTEVAGWASLLVGDMSLRRGGHALFVSRVEANRELDQAVNSYLDVLKVSNRGELAKQATLGLARAYESKGDLKNARERYQDVIKSWANTAAGKLAKSRLADLDRPETKSFYDRLAAYNPGSQFADEPGTPGKMPSLDPSSLQPGESLLPGAELEPGLKDMLKDKKPLLDDKTSVDDKASDEKAGSDKLDLTPKAPPAGMPKLPSVDPPKKTDDKPEAAKK